MTRITDRDAIETMIDSLMGHRAIMSDIESFRPGLPTIYDCVVDEYMLSGWDVVEALDFGSVVVIRMCDDVYEASGSVSMRSVTIIR